MSIHNDNDDVLSRARIQGTYDAETYGVKLGIGTDFGGYGRSDTRNVVSVYNAYGWYNFLNGVINVKGGLIDDAVWNTAGPEDWNLSNGLGVRLEVVPIEGLNLGVFLNTGADNFAQVTAEQFFKETTIGVSYKHSLFDASLAFKLDSDSDLYAVDADGDLKAVEQERLYQYVLAQGLGAGWFTDEQDFWDQVGGSGPGTGTKADTIEEIYDQIDQNGYEATFTTFGIPVPKDYDNYQLIFGFAYKGIEALTAKAEARIWGLSEFSKVGFAWFNEEVAYQILDPLKAGIVLTQYFYASDSEIDPYWKFKPYVEYKVADPVLIGLEVPVWFQNDVTDFGLGAKPWVKYSFTDDVYLKAFYSLTYTDPKAGDSTTDHAIQLDLVWSF
ncbi:MAG: hypothetical protein LBC31_03680 [Treponema sp.]|nr:hypothetical protein [Treponema sp.]